MSGSVVRLKMLCAALAIAVAMAVSTHDGNAQARRELLPSEPVPLGFRSYSFFLVCAPGWLGGQSRADVVKLYGDFLGFGDAIGRNHVAVWFRRDASAAALDADRHVEYCEKLGLTPSKTPAIAIVANENGARYNTVVAYLGGRDAKAISAVLDSLVDQIIGRELDQETVDSKLFWTKLWQIFRDTGSGAASWIKEIKIQVGTADGFSLEATAAPPR